MLKSLVADVIQSWKTLVVTDLLFKAVAFVALTPLAGGLFRIFIAASGNTVLSDADIIKYFLGPAGWIGITIGGATVLGIAALEQAPLMGILCAARANQHLRVSSAMRFAAVHAWPVLRVTVRIVGFTLLAVTPFLAALAAVYSFLLTEYDINYYLVEKPPVFQVSLGMGGLILLGMAAMLLRLFSGWIFALPLVLFEKIRPAEALRESHSRSLGKRRTIVLWIVAWIVATTLLSAATSGAVGLLGRALVPPATSSLRLLSLTVGFAALVWFAGNLFVSLLSVISAGAILFHLYCRIGCDGAVAGPRLGAPREVAEGDRFRWTRGRLASLGIIGVIATVGVGGLIVSSVSLQDSVKVMAHRGASTQAPENSMAAIRGAIDAGADFVEIDVQETADGEVVVFHDSDLMKLSNRQLRLSDATMEDLADVDIGGWFDEKFQDQRVPTLGQVLDECKGRINVNIELKYYGHGKQLEQRVADIVDSRGMGAEVVVMSLNAAGVRKMRSLRPKWKVGQVMSVAAGNLSKMKVDFLAVNATFTSYDLIRTAHQNKMEVYVWTVNDAPTMSSMISRGVDGLLTDDVALARSVIEQRAQMSVPERLLLEFAWLLGVKPKFGEQ